MVNFMKTFQLVRKEDNGKEKWFIRYFDGIKIKTKTCRNCNTQKEAKEFAKILQMLNFPLFFRKTRTLDFLYSHVLDLSLLQSKALFY